MRRVFQLWKNLFHLISFFIYTLLTQEGCVEQTATKHLLLLILCILLPQVCIKIYCSPNYKGEWSLFKGLFIIYLCKNFNLIVVHSCNYGTLGRLKWEDHKFNANLSYTETGSKCVSLLWLNVLFKGNTSHNSIWLYPWSLVSKMCFYFSN